jgi:BT1 family
MAEVPASLPAPIGAIWRWVDRNILDLGRQMRLSYLPPLMVYMAAGISGLTGIVGTFFVKEYLGLSAHFLAALGFWATLPWALKMPLGHIVDLIWRHKAGLVYLGAGLIAASVVIMVGLLGYPAVLRAVMPAGAWFVLSTLLAPIGYVLQDTVADAMTVEAVPRVDTDGRRLTDEERRLSQITMQTLGRVAIIGGGVLVSVANVILFRGVGSMTTAQKAATYLQVYEWALIIPAISILGVVLASILRRRAARRLAATGLGRAQIRALLDSHVERPAVNWWILGGGLVFVAFSILLGLSDVPWNEEIIFSGSMIIVLILIWRLTRELEPGPRNVLIGTALLIFVFRATPTPGAGSTWWMIDTLGFDQQFLSVLALISAALTLAGLFVFRRFMAERSIVYVIGFLTVAGTLLALPPLGMFYGLHQWTASLTHGVVDAHFIALVDTALESPLGQIAMVPMLAWIANSAPDRLKATYFAVMASFTNLALSLSQLGTKYLNGIFEVTRQVTDANNGTILAPANYSELGHLYLAVIAIGFGLPMLAVIFVKATRFRSA